MDQRLIQLALLTALGLAPTMAFICHGLLHCTYRDCYRLIDWPRPVAISSHGLLPTNLLLIFKKFWLGLAAVGPVFRPDTLSKGVFGVNFHQHALQQRLVRCSSTNVLKFFGLKMPFYELNMKVEVCSFALPSMFFFHSRALYASTSSQKSLTR